MPKDENLIDVWMTLVDKNMGISQTRISELEKTIFHDYGGDLNKIEDAAVIQIELVKKVSELKDNVDSNRGQINANLDGINYCRKFMFNLEKVLRELLNNLYGKTPRDIKELQAKLEGKDGEKSGILGGKSSSSEMAVKSLARTDLKPSKKGCFSCKYFIDDNNHCEERDMDSYKEFQYTTFLTAICNNWQGKDGEKADYPKCGWTEEKPFCHHTESKPSTKYLNPQLQCDGECYSCADNIPSHGNVPNQCGRQQLKEKESTEAGSARQTVCKTCGSELTRDLNDDLFCMRGVIIEEKHDDYIPRDWVKVLKADLEFIFSKDPEFMNMVELKRRRQIKEKYLGKKEDADAK